MENDGFENLSMETNLTEDGDGSSKNEGESSSSGETHQASSSISTSSTSSLINEPLSSDSDSKTQLDERVTELAKSFKEKCFYEKDVTAALENVPPVEIVGTLNRLLVKGVIEIFHIKGKGTLAYKYKTNLAEAYPEVTGLDNEEKIIYGVIKEAGNTGIWMRDIRYKSGSSLTQLNKILKSLEGKKIIKAVKSVNAYKKKVYMLYDLEPDSALTGGSWYSDQDFESEFVDVLNQQCYRYLLDLKKKANENTLSKKGPLTVRHLASAVPKDVCEFITNLGISKIPLSEEDIRTILDTLLYDGKVERKATVKGTFCYRAVEPCLPSQGVSVVPCSVCPAVYRCQENNQLTPIKCRHINEWGETKHNQS